MVVGGGPTVVVGGGPAVVVGGGPAVVVGGGPAVVVGGGPAVVVGGGPTVVVGGGPAVVVGRAVVVRSGVVRSGVVCSGVVCSGGRHVVGSCRCHVGSAGLEGTVLGEKLKVRTAGNPAPTDCSHERRSSFATGSFSLAISRAICSCAIAAWMISGPAGCPSLRSSPAARSAHVTASAHISQMEAAIGLSEWTLRERGS